MEPTSNTCSITWLKTHAAEALRSLAEDRKPLVLTQNGEARAVLLDIESYQERERAVALLRIVAQSDADLASGRTVSQEEAFAMAAQAIEEAD